MSPKEGDEGEGGATHHSTIADLDGLKQMQKQLSAVAREEDTVAGLGGVIDFVRKVNGLQRGNKIRDHTSETKVHGLLRGTLEAKSVLDNFLESTGTSDVS